MAYAAGAGAAPAAAAHGSRRIVIIGTMAALFLAALDQTIVSSAFPRIIGELDGLALLPWVFTSYMLAATTIVPIAGKLGDQFGRKPLFLVAIVVFLLGSFAAGAAQSMLQLVIARGVQGFGGGMLFSTAFAVVGDLYAPIERGRIQGAFAAVFGLSSVVGPSMGGWITDALNWRWVFLINVPVGIGAFAVVFIGMPWVRPHLERRPRLDVLGSALLVGTLVPLLLALTWGGDRYAWGSTPIVALFAVAGVGLPLFLFVESRAPEPVLPLDLFRNRTFVVCAIVVFLLGAGMFGAITMVPTFLQGVQGVAAGSSGTLMTPMTLSIAVSGAIGGQIMTRTGRYKALVVVSLAVVALGMFLFSRSDADTGRAVTVRNMIIVGLGMGVSFPIFTTVVQNALPFDRIGVATASSTFFRQVGATVGVAVLSGLMIHDFRGGVREVAGDLPAFAQNPDALLNERGVEGLRRVYESSGVPGLPPFDGVLALTRVQLADAIGLVFLIAAGLIALAWAVSFTLPELPLQSVSPAEQMRRMREAKAADGGAGVPAPADAP